MVEKRDEIVLGIDLGGTNTKIGLVNMQTYSFECLRIIRAPTDSERTFFRSIHDIATEIIHSCNVAPSKIGVAVGSFVFSDGKIDGMSFFVPYLVRGYPLASNFENCFKLPVTVLNDAQAICLAEVRLGNSYSYHRVLSLTLGTGIGSAFCVDGHLTDHSPYMHLAGHIMVRSPKDYAYLDSPQCYCGIPGCFESSCSGTALDTIAQHVLARDVAAIDLFQAAALGDLYAYEEISRYLRMLSRRISELAYVYCPDAVVIGGGVSKALSSWKRVIEKTWLLKYTTVTPLIFLFHLWGLPQE